MGGSGERLLQKASARSGLPFHGWASREGGLASNLPFRSFKHEVSMRRGNNGTPHSLNPHPLPFPLLFQSGPCSSTLGPVTYAPSLSRPPSKPKATLIFYLLPLSIGSPRFLSWWNISLQLPPTTVLPNSAPTVPRALILTKRSEAPHRPGPAESNLGFLLVLRLHCCSHERRVEGESTSTGLGS